MTNHRRIRVPSKVKGLLREATALGFVAAKTGGGHLRSRHTVTGEIVFASTTPSCRFALIKARRALRRAATVSAEATP